LEGTLSNLLEEKRHLEEKMTMLNDNVSRLEELTKECDQLRSTLVKCGILITSQFLITFFFRNLRKLVSALRRNA